MGGGVKERRNQEVAPIPAQALLLLDGLDLASPQCCLASVSPSARDVGL